MPTSEPPFSEKPDEAAPTTIGFVGLPPKTLKADIHPVVQHFGEVRRMTMHPGGRNAEA
jgi:hypothetical protein